MSGSKEIKTSPPGYVTYYNMAQTAKPGKKRMYGISLAMSLQKKEVSDMDRYLQGKLAAAELVNPWIPWTRDDEREIVNYRFSSVYPPRIYDSQGNSIVKVLVLAKNSIVRVKYSVYIYPKGMNLSLYAIQVIKYIRYGKQPADNDIEFEAVDGGYVVGETGEMESEDEEMAGNTEPINLENRLPF